MLSSRLPWHALIRPDVKLRIKYFRSLVTLRIQSSSQKDVEITFNKNSGVVVDISRQICSMWTVDNFRELSLSVDFAYNTVVRFGIKTIKGKKK